MLRIFLLTSLMVLTTAMGQKKDGPFGIFMGMPKEEITKILHDSVTQTEDEFSLRINPPRAQEEYGWYVVTVGEKAGVCVIQASSLEHLWPGPARYRPASPDIIMDQLVEQFGKPTDFLERNPPWGTSDTTIWELENNSENIRRVKFNVTIRLKDHSEPILGVIFEFENFEQCLDESWASTYRQIEEQENK